MSSKLMKFGGEHPNDTEITHISAYADDENNIVTVQFAVFGANYCLDLTPRKARKLRKQLKQALKD